MVRINTCRRRGNYKNSNCNKITKFSNQLLNNNSSSNKAKTKTNLNLHNLFLKIAESELKSARAPTQPLIPLSPVQQQQSNPSLLKNSNRLPKEANMKKMNVTVKVNRRVLIDMARIPAGKIKTALRRIQTRRRQIRHYRIRHLWVQLQERPDHN